MSDGISYEGKLWLVPQWLKHKTESHGIPARIIRFDQFPFQWVDPLSNDGVEYQNIQLPISESQLQDVLPGSIEFEDHPYYIQVDMSEIRRH